MRFESVLLLRAVGRKKLRLLARYHVNTLSKIGTVFALFLIIFVGGRAATGGAITDSLGGIIVGFFLYTMALESFSSVSNDISREKMWGTLEQLYLSAHGFRRVIAAKVVVNVFVSFLLGSGVLALMLVTTGERLHFDVVSIVVVGTLTLATAVGLGFVFAALAIIYRRIQSLFRIVNLVLLGFVAAPVEGNPLLKLIPLTLGSHLIRRIMVDGVPFWQLPAADLWLLVAKAAVYVVVGGVVFAYGVDVARRRGVFGHY